MIKQRGQRSKMVLRLFCNQKTVGSSPIVGRENLVELVDTIDLGSIV